MFFQPKVNLHTNLDLTSFVVFCGKTHWKANKTEKTLFLIAEKAIKTTDYSGIIAILEVFQVL